MSDKSYAKCRVKAETPCKGPVSRESGEKDRVKVEQQPIKCTKNGEKTGRSREKAV